MYFAMYFAIHSGTLIYEHRYISTASSVCAGGVYAFSTRHIAVSPDRPGDWRLGEHRHTNKHTMAFLHGLKDKKQKGEPKEEKASPVAQPASGPPATRPRLERGRRNHPSLVSAVVTGSPSNPPAWAAWRRILAPRVDILRPQLNNWALFAALAHGIEGGRDACIGGVEAGGWLIGLCSKGDDDVCC